MISETKIRVFLSSPMGSREWMVRRDAIAAFFNNSPMNDWCELRQIENHSGDPPE
jgi:hypothetical protein